MTKFSPENETLRIIRCYDSIPNQLSETNKRHMYSRIDGTGSRKGSRQYMEALLWIGGAPKGPSVMFLDQFFAIAAST